MLALKDGVVQRLRLPSPESEIFPGVLWGRFDVLYTPAFWAGRDWVHRLDRSYSHVRLGSNLREEVVACILGGYGVPAEVGIAAFHCLRDAGVIEGNPTARRVAGLLAEPLNIGSRRVHYRFARQRAEYVAAALKGLLREQDLPQSDLALRGHLLTLPGIGPKTASWITRNIRASDEVAILDIHICRACSTAGVFSSDAHPGRDYFGLEARFLKFARALGARASHLDNVIWQTMRRLSGHLRSLGPAQA